MQLRLQLRSNGATDVVPALRSPEAVRVTQLRPNGPSLIIDSG